MNDTDGWTGLRRLRRRAEHRKQPYVFSGVSQADRGRIEHMSLAVSKVTFLVIGMRNAWDMATFVIMRGDRIDGWSG